MKVVRLMKQFSTHPHDNATNLFARLFGSLSLFLGKICFMWLDTEGLVWFWEREKLSLTSGSGLTLSVRTQCSSQSIDIRQATQWPWWMRTQTRALCNHVCTQTKSQTRLKRPKWSNIPLIRVPGASSQSQGLRTSPSLGKLCVQTQSQDASCLTTHNPEHSSASQPFPQMS